MVGQDLNRLLLKSEGTYALDEGTLESGTIEPLCSRPIIAFFDAQIGVQYEAIGGKDDRVFGSVGVEGLAPGFYNVDPTLFVSTQSEVSITAEVEYDRILTQRQILQPRVEARFQFQAAPDYGLGSGFSDIGMGLRLRYEVTRRFAPYLRVSYARSFGDTADMARASGDAVDTLYGVVSARIWF